MILRREYVQRSLRVLRRQLIADDLSHRNGRPILSHWTPQLGALQPFLLLCGGKFADVRISPRLQSRSVSLQPQFCRILVGIARRVCSVETHFCSAKSRSSLARAVVAVRRRTQWLYMHGAMILPRLCGISDFQAMRPGSAIGVAHSNQARAFADFRLHLRATRSVALSLDSTPSVALLWLVVPRGFLPTAS